MLGKILRYVASLAPLSLSARAGLYRLSGVQLGRRVAIDRGVHMTRPDLLRVGDRVTISTGVSLLGEITAVHSRLNERYGLQKSRPITIEDDVFIGVKATVLPGITVGKEATIGANTLVTADVPPRGVVLGVPGRLVLVRPDPDAPAD